MQHEWKRPGPFHCDGQNGLCGCEDDFEYATTEDLTPPPGDGWVLASKFAVGRVKGAGESPSRPSR